MVRAPRALVRSVLRASPFSWSARGFVVAACGALVILAACTGSDEPETSAVPRLQRVLPVEPETRSADWPRSEIGAETRPVLSTQRVFVLRDAETIELRESLRIETELPEALRSLPGLLVEHRLSSRDPALEGDSFLEWRTGGRIRIEPPPIAVMGPGELPARIVEDIDIPEALRGASGLLTVIARALPAEPIERFESGAFDVPRGMPARLEFGIGVEKDAWRSGFPPVHFRTFVAEVADQPEGERAPVAPPKLVHERRLDPGRDPRERRFFDASVDLSPFAGKRVRFVFEAEALVDRNAPPEPDDDGDGGGPVYSRSFPVFANPELVSGPRLDPDPGSSRPNVILVSLDTLRARSLALYGHVRDTMPKLEARLARRGAWVTEVVAPYSFTPPSHMTMLTGLEPCAHGIHGRNDVLAANRDTLAELLRAEGYRTGAVTEDAYVVAGAGFARGFDRYVEFRSEETAAPGFIIDTFGEGEDWLRTRAREPFFLFLHTYQVHDPYVPPRGYLGLFPDDVQTSGKRHEAELRAYEQEARYTDDVLASLLDTLEAEGLAENTLVVVTSDHGESFGEHLVVGHGFSIHDEEILVPLVMRGPGVTTVGRRVEAQVGLVDLVPTLLDLVGLDVPEMVQGESFAALLRPETPTDAVAEQARPWTDPPRTSQVSVGGRRSVRTPAWKYFHNPAQPAANKPEREFVYHLSDDPMERKDLSTQDTATLALGRAALAEHDRACEAWNARYPARAPGVEGALDRPGWMLNRDEIEAKLRSLGYVE